MSLFRCTYTNIVLVPSLQATRTLEWNRQAILITAADMDGDKKEVQGTSAEITTVRPSLICVAIPFALPL